MTNKKLWNSVKMTDPSAVKAITGKTYQGSSPKPYWIIEKATETFGPIGIGWGVTVKSERFEHVSPTDVLHVAVVSIWYVLDGVRSETFDQMGGTKAAYMTAKGVLLVDEDAGKKSVTDGMVKCLSMLGFAGDIFSGQWNDSKYVEFAAQQYADAGATERRAQWITERKADIANAKTVGALKRIMDAALETTANNGDQAAADELLEASASKVAKAKTPEVTA